MQDVILELDAHCIETSARIRHRELAGRVLISDGRDREAEAAYELLTSFLQVTDFRKLRFSDPDLAGGRQVRVRVTRDDTGQVIWKKIPTA